jgi:hypothetical protein
MKELKVCMGRVPWQIGVARKEMAKEGTAEGYIIIVILINASEPHTTTKYLAHQIITGGGCV